MTNTSNTRTIRQNQSRQQTGYQSKYQPTRQTEQRLRRIKRRRRQRLCICLIWACSLLCIVLSLYSLVTQSQFAVGELFSHTPESPILPEEDIPAELKELLEHNEEARLFVEEYPNREVYLKREIDLSKDSNVKEALASDEPPLLMQWDLRWGYAPYGDGMIGLAGCGPTCLSMAYISLTGDTSKNPAAIADFAYNQGYYTEYGTAWALWTDGAASLGLKGETLSLSESVMKSALDDGALIVCSMRPGDFTTTGHFILIWDYDEQGFLVKDPNRQSNSDRAWSYDELSWQIKNLWGLSAP
ncbi:MAG: C39 family peptidase [Butyrivibrio sp.]|nr:C39 family peptidase [Butyrivibrio sp.]